MLSNQELKDVSIFACLDDELRAEFARKAADVHLQPGEYLTHEGEQASFFVIIDGTIEILKQVMGRPTVVVESKAGEFFGELAILTGTTTPVSARAKIRCRLARFEAEHLHELIRQSATCSGIILQTLNERLAKVQDYLVSMPLSRVTISGSEYDSACREIRAFLSMNRIPYSWVNRHESAVEARFAVGTDLACSTVVVDGAEPLVSPTLRKVAEALGLQTKPLKDHYDVVVIGGGPAGLAAAVYGASEGLCVLLVERNAAGGQAGSSTRIENYLGFPSGISGDELSDRAFRQAIRFGAEIVLTREVRAIEPVAEGYCIDLDDGQRVQTKTVILAIGVDWRRLEAEGVDPLIGRGVLYGAARTEAQTVVGKDIFIVGGGNSAGQAALFFANYTNSVTILIRGESLERSMSQYLIEQIALKPKIRVEASTKVISVEGNDHLQTICTQKFGEACQRRQAGALFVLIGADASTSWLPPQLQRDENGYICTGRDVTELSQWKDQRAPFLLETNLPGFFCAGDVRHDSIKRVSSGVGEGSMAIAFVHQYLATI